jgi:aldehyde:ferredoxin oxidoreductase
MQSILKIDLSTCTTDEYIIPKEWERDYLGGASLAARLLYSSLIPDLDPLSPEAPLLLMTGPLTGTAGPAVGRFVASGRSPLTGLWAESNCGGFWGSELRFAGYDGIWITGKAENPVYLWLNNGMLEIRDASGLWGQDTYEVQNSVKKELNQPSAHVLGIGPAGERCVRFASILCDHGRTAGRTGLGAIMGSKNLKAIAVYGNNKISLVDQERFESLRSAANRLLKMDNVSRVMHDVGTVSGADYSEYLGSMPKRYYQDGIFKDIDKISGATQAETILVGTSACHACVIACGRVVCLKDGKKRKGPEYESTVGFGPNLLVSDLEAITKLSEICDRYGVDTISMSNTIGLAFRLYERRIINATDVGFPLLWGDTSAIEELIHLTVRRNGIGALLAEGSLRFGQHFGVEDEAIQVNGLEVAYHDPRGVSGMALVYATSPRGACHNQSDYFYVDWGQAEPSLGLEFFSRQAGAEKAANVAHHQDWRTITNALVMCFFANVTAETTVDLINAACGLDWTVKDMLRAGERGWNLKRAINNRLGLTQFNDRLPKALLEPLQDGGAAGYIIPFNEMLMAYYHARDWDPGTGRPTREKLYSLDLGDVAEDLWD